MRLGYKAKRSLEEAVKASGEVVDGQFIYAVGKNDAIVAASQNLTLDPQHQIGERDVGRVRREMFGSVRKPKAKPDDPAVAFAEVRRSIRELQDDFLHFQKASREMLAKAVPAATHENLAQRFEGLRKDLSAFGARLIRLETDLGVKPPPLPVAHSGADR